MDAALTATVVGVLLGAMLATIGWLIKGRLEDIAEDVRHVNITLDDMPAKLYTITERVVWLEAWTKYHAEQRHSGT